MPIDLQYLDQRFPIVDPKTGQPTDYFLRLLRGQTGALGEELEVVEGELSDKADKTITLTAGTGLDGGGDLSANRTFDLADTAVTPGSYTSTDLTVDAQGRITAAASGSSGGLSVEDGGSVVVASATTLNFIGATVTDAGGGQADITVSGGGGGVPTIIQQKIVARSNLSTGITLDAAPTNGSMLVAIILNTVATTPPPATTGWTTANSNTGLPDSLVAYKIAGSSETALQNPTTATEGGIIVMYEIADAGAIVSDLAATTTATSIVVPFATNAEYLPTSKGLGIVFGGRRSDQAGSWSGSFANDLSLTDSGGTVGGTGLSVNTGIASVPLSSTLTATCTWSTSVTSKGGFVLVA